MKIKLIANELAIIKAIANKRTRRCMEENVRRTWQQNGSTEEERTKNRYENDIQAFAAEFAFCRIANLMPDFTTHVRDGGYDCILRDGTTVDIKETFYETGKLLVKVERNKGILTKQEDVDLYVLMIGKIPSFRFAGFATASMVFQAPITKPRFAQSYTLTQDTLLPFSELSKHGVVREHNIIA